MNMVHIMPLSFVCISSALDFCKAKIVCFPAGFGIARSLNQLMLHSLSQFAGINKRTPKSFIKH